MKGNEKMKKIAMKLTSLVLVLLIAVTVMVLPAVAANVTTQSVTGERTDIVFLEGKVGDTYLVYTYKQDGKSYKVVEDATMDFANVHSTIYVLDSTGNYVEDSTQEVSTNSNGDLIVTLSDENKTVEKRTISSTPKAFSVQVEQAQSATSYEWITSYSNGDTYLGNYTSY